MLGSVSVLRCPLPSEYDLLLVSCCFFLLGISEENLAKLCEHAQIPSDYRLVFFSHIRLVFAHKSHKKLYKHIT